MKQIISQNSRKDSDPFVDTTQQPSKFKKYIEEKVQKIQETKMKTIKMTEKYFTQLKEKMEKYLAKEQKKILNAYEDNINMSVNCMNHQFLYDFETIWFKNGKTQRKPSKVICIVENDQQPRKKSYQSQNQLTIKIQVKRLIEQMLLVETHLSQTVKLVGQQLKSDLQKLIDPLGQLFAKIPKLTQVSENSSTLLIKETPSTNEKKKGKNLNKMKKNESFNVKNPEISAQKIKIIQNLQDLNELNLSQNMTQKLFNKSNMQKESIHELRLHDNNKLLKLKLQKQDKAASILNKNLTDKTLKDFDFINGKSLLHIYRKYVSLQNINQREANYQREEFQDRIQLILNEKTLLEASLNEPNYEGYCKIEFESKPDREYLAVLMSKFEAVQEAQNTRKHKNYQMTIFNYKGDVITKDLVQNLKVSETQNSVKIFQIPCLRQYVFIVLNNRIKRYSLTNLWNQKAKLFPTEQKIIKAEINDDKIILFEGRNKSFYLMNSDLILMQTFRWDTIYPQGISMTDFINMKVQRPHKNETQSLTPRDSEISLIIPKTPIDALYYFEKNSIKKLDLQIVRESIPTKGENICLRFIELVSEIYPGVYLIVSKRNLVRSKSDIFVMEISSKRITLSEENEQLKATISYLDTLNEEIIQSRFLKNQLYVTLRRGKVIAYSLC